MKTIDMSSVVGSDTLCISAKNRDLFTLNADHVNHLNAQRVEIKQDFWQSTSNHLVLPHGLVCDIKYLSVGLTYIKYHEGVKSSDDFLNSTSLINVLAVKVTGKEEGYRYEWEIE